ncbi:MAG: phosphate starvation-inducible protein PhoH [Rhodospirillaceae bacterium]|nr:phosphate starvation-inducible protein PhoH [Rhodospirillaceae bacterium]
MRCTQIRFLEYLYPIFLRRRYCRLVHNSKTRATESLLLEFENNELLPLLFGDFDRHLARIEQSLCVTIASRGNSALISGDQEEINATRKVLESLYEKLGKGVEITLADVDSAIRFAREGVKETQLEGGQQQKVASMVRTPKRQILPRSKGQRRYMEALSNSELTFGLGPAGTGKTYLAVGMAVCMLTSGKIDRIVLSRPAVEAGERLGFLPGAMRDKIDPFLRPLYDALYDMMPSSLVDRRLDSGEIEIAPLAFMRGRTLSNSYVILDEAQNATSVQMKMFLTRLGENSRIVATGDLSQIDLPRGVTSGLKNAVRTLEGLDGVKTIRMTADDVVRHELVSRIVKAYDTADKSQDEHA